MVCLAGKTTTLLRFCEAAGQLLQPCGGKLLAVAASNVAVDNLVSGLMALGVKVVRLGQPVKVGLGRLLSSNCKQCAAYSDVRSVLQQYTHCLHSL
jgi:hypothetical protein